MKDRIEINVNDGIADVRLVRAAKMNALDDAMMSALVQALEQLKADKSIRVVVLSGEGRAFCAGLDMGNFGKMVDKSLDGDLADLLPRTHGVANMVQHICWGWRELPVPVIAAVHGTAFGGGFQLALGADIRFAEPDTRFSVMEIKWGLVPDMAGTQLMRHLAREDVIRELCYTGRQFDADDAKQYGFVTHVVSDPRAAAMEMAAHIATRNPDAIAANKRILNAAPYCDAQTGLVMESQEQQDILGSANQIEAVMAELEKRPAQYKS